MDSKLFHRVFSSTDGKALFDALCQQYINREIFDPDPLVMARNSAEHDLIIFIGAMIENGGSND